MALEVVLPKVDMDMESGVIAEWKVAEGDFVRAGDILFDMETAKSVMEVEAPGTGRIRGLAPIDGEPVAVGTAVAWIDEVREDATAAEAVAAPGVSPVSAPGGSTVAAPGESPVAAPGVSRAAAPGVSPAASSTARPAAVSDARAAAPQAGATTVTDATATAQPRPLDDFVRDLVGGELRATPYARTLGREHGVDLTRLDGSGPLGRVQAADVLHAAQPRDAVPAATPTQTRGEAGTASTDAGVSRVPFTPTRRVIAERLVESVQTAPHFYLTAHIEMTALRAALAAATPGIVATTGAKPGMTVALARLVALVLARHPLVNASVDGAAAELHAYAHIGIAMDRDGELCVPVMRDAGTRTFAELTVEFARLRAAVMARTIQPAEMRGGTFTISNLGMHGVDAFTAIINPPQSAILAVGRTVDTPVGRDGAVVLRPMATLSLSSDHRIVDGVTAARFMADLRRAIEQPDALA